MLVHLLPKVVFAPYHGSAPASHMETLVRHSAPRKHGQIALQVVGCQFPEAHSQHHPGNPFWVLMCERMMTPRRLMIPECVMFHMGDSEKHLVWGFLLALSFSSSFFLFLFFEIVYM